VVENPHVEIQSGTMSSLPDLGKYVAVSPCELRSEVEPGIRRCKPLISVKQHSFYARIDEHQVSDYAGANNETPETSNL
jgi:hypothetical protein